MTVKTKEHSSRMRTTRFCGSGGGEQSLRGARSRGGTVLGERLEALLLCGQTDTCENITFPQLRLPAVTLWNSKQFFVKADELDQKSLENQRRMSALAVSPNSSHAMGNFLFGWLKFNKPLAYLDFLHTQ